MIKGYVPPAGWRIAIWVGEPAHLKCPSCGEGTQFLLAPKDGSAIAFDEQRCPQCLRVGLAS